MGLQVKRTFYIAGGMAKTRLIAGKGDEPLIPTLTGLGTGENRTPDSIL